MAAELTVVVVSRSDPEKRFEKPYMGVPVASFALKDGVVDAVSHGEGVPFLVESARANGLYSPSAKRMVTLRDGLDFLAALLVQVGKSSYLTTYAVGPDGSPAKLRLTDEGKLEVL